MEATNHSTVIKPGIIARLQDFAVKHSAHCLAAFIISIYISTALAIISSVILGLVWLLSARYKSIPEILKKSPVALSAICLYLLFVIGLTYGDTPVHEALSLLKKYRELLFIPILLSFFDTEKNYHWAWKAFLIGSVMTLLGSYLMDLGVVDLLRHRSFTIKSRITHSIFLAYFMYYCAHKAVDTKTNRIWFGLLIVLSFYNLFFMVNGRTGQLVFLLLSLLFAVQRFGKAGFMKALMILILFFTSFYYLSQKSSRIHESFNSTKALIEHTVKPNVKGGEARYSFWENSLEMIVDKPLFGYGTGSFSQEYKKTVDTKQIKINNPHNEFLLITVQLGIMGLTVYSLFFFSQIYASGKLPQKEKWLAQGMIVTLLITSMFNSPFLDHTEGHWFSVMLALCFSGNVFARKKITPPQQTKSLFDFFIGQSYESSSGLKVYRRLLVYVKPYIGLFSISILGFFIYSCTQPLQAKLIQHIIDTLQSKTREGINYLPLFFSGLIIIQGIGTYLGNYFLAKVSTNVVHSLRSQIFDKYLELPTFFFDNNNSGHLISRITNNVGEVTKASTDSIRTFVREGLTVIGLLVYLFHSNWKLSLIFLFITPIIVLLVRYVSKRLRIISRKIQDSVGDITHITSELVTGHRIVRGYGGEDYERRRFAESSQFNRRQSLKLATTTAVHNPIMQIIIAIALSFLMYMALIFMKQSTAGEFAGYLMAAFMLLRPVRQLSDANNDIQKGIAAAESIFAVLDQEPETDKGTYRIGRATGKLEFKNVSFTYSQAQEPALVDISFTANPGQVIALVGASGGGKSTLVNLVSRYYPHENGQILLDGVEISEYQLTNLRQQIALVTQHVTLFNDTIANNIAYGSLATANREEIIAAATDAYAMEFISKQKHGLDTRIGENGIKLSGGQRQRLALARALLKDAPVLILDEATSALDTASERYIQQALEKLMSSRTTLVIAHRLSTIEKADLILVMERGRIVERGNHEELIAKQGAYARLHRMEFEESRVTDDSRVK